MKADIKCLVCGEFLGTLDKDLITAQDILMYQKSETCSLGHVASGLLNITDPNEGI